MSSESILDKLAKIQDLSDKWIYLIFIIGITIPTLFPLGLPVKVSEPTMNIYNYINSLKPGDIVIFQGGIMPLAVPELYTSMKSLMRHIFSMPGVRVYVPASGAYNIEIFIRAAKEIWGDPRSIPGKTYGVDYVILPYIAFTTAVLAQNPQSIWQVDYFGTPVNQLPLYNAYKSAKDAKLAVHFNVGPAYEDYIRYFYIMSGTKLVMPVYAYMYTELLPYYTTGQVVGYMISVRGGAEYEQLLGIKGESTSATDALSGTYVWILVIVLIGNLAKYAKKTQSGGVK